MASCLSQSDPIISATNVRLPLSKQGGTRDGQGMGLRNVIRNNQEDGTFKIFDGHDRDRI